MNMIWATRGKNWGFKFLMDGGYSDPLPAYEEVFEAYSMETEFWYSLPDRAGLRFPDPLHRKDSSGRLIFHDFVILDRELMEIRTFQEARELVWSQVEKRYSELWDR